MIEWTEGGESLPPFHRRWYYCAKDCINTYDVWETLYERADPELLRTYEFFMRLCQPLMSMSLRGCAMDTEVRVQQLNELEATLERLEGVIGHEVRKLIPREEWMDLVVGERIEKGTMKFEGKPYMRVWDRYDTRPLSPNDNAKTAISDTVLGAILYDYLGLRPRRGRGKKPKRGWSVDKEALASLLKDPKTKRKGADVLIESRLAYMDAEKQAGYLRGPFRNGRWTYVLKPGRETFRISGSKDPLPEVVR